MTTALDFADVDELATLLEAHADIASATMDPANLNTPGVLIQVTGVAPGTLSGLTIRLQLLALVANTTPRAAAAELQDLYNAVASVVDDLGGPSGDATVGTWSIAGLSAELPGIAIPFDLLTT